jgi:hypothetical protein
MNTLGLGLPVGERRRRFTQHKGGLIGGPVLGPGESLELHFATKTADLRITPLED